MTSFPSLSFRDLIKKVQKLGFVSARQKGSHIRFIHPDGRKTIIPDHGGKDVPHGLLVTRLSSFLIENFAKRGSGFSYSLLSNSKYMLISKVKIMTIRKA